MSNLIESDKKSISKASWFSKYLLEFPKLFSLLSSNLGFPLAALGFALYSFYRDSNEGQKVLERLGVLEGEVKRWSHLLNNLSQSVILDTALGDILQNPCEAKFPNLLEIFIASLHGPEFDPELARKIARAIKVLTPFEMESLVLFLERERTEEYVTDPGEAILFSYGLVGFTPKGREMFQSTYQSTEAGKELGKLIVQGRTLLRQC